MTRGRRRMLGAAAAAALLAGCGVPPRRMAVPERLTARAVIPGLEQVRYIEGDPTDMARLARDIADTWPRERRWLQSQGHAADRLPPSHMLALSGGGDNGAFGAGLLNGWTAHGTRPEFSLVTGISTGALIAPFAFLGPGYDDRLRALYTRSAPEDIVRARGLLAALTDDAVADTSPLRALLQRQIDQPFLDAIAAEYHKGRELWISTTNLDARQRVIWNMTRLAASGHPRALTLFHDVMLASSAIPGAFPPVMIDVELNGRPHHEMHVDGGTMAQVFIYPPSVRLGALSAEGGGTRERHLYVIRNARVDPDWAETERRVISIASRAISSMIHTQGVGDLYRIYLTTRRDGVSFNLAYIPEDFRHPHRREFDTEFMQALYDRAFRMAVTGRGYPWHQRPPGFDDVDDPGGLPAR